LFLTHLAIMGTTIPASLLMGVLGRRAGFTLGALMGVAAGGMGCYAMLQQSFPLLCLATVLMGMQAGFFWYFRLAAADAAEPAFRAKAISLVMAGGVIAGFLGPETAKWAVDLLAPVTFAGIYAAMIAYSVAVLMLVQYVRIPRLSVQERAAGGRPMREIVRQPAYRVALAASVFGYAVMTLTMSATPLAMLACGFNFTDSATVIQAHIVAMFLPSFFTGHLISRIGALPVIAAGGLIEVGCAIVNLAGVDFANFLIANILVGLGWNFAYVGGSTLLTSTYRLAERAKVQASHDFTVYLATATAAALSGLLQAKAGWTILNLAALPLMATIVTVAVRLMLRQRRAAMAPAE
jgi:MFS family permease